MHQSYKKTTMKQQHGGDLDALMHRHGIDAETILDLSTGICPRSWPVPPDLLDLSAWQVLLQPGQANAALADWR